jgi:hypothetical protein
MVKYVIHAGGNRARAHVVRAAHTGAFGLCCATLCQSEKETAAPCHALEYAIRPPFQPPSLPCCGTISMSPSALARHESSMHVVAVYMWIAYPVFCSALRQQTQQHTRAHSTQHTGWITVDCHYFSCVDGIASLLLRTATKRHTQQHTMHANTGIG